MPTASPARWGYAKAANEAWVNQTVRVNPSLNVGGQTIKVPASMKLAANAPRFAAAALFLNPQLRFALGVVSWLSAAKVIWDEASQQWMTKGDISSGYSLWSDPWSGQHIHSSPPCASWWPGSVFVQTSELTGQCRLSAGTLTTLNRTKNSNEEQSRPLTKEEYERKLAPEVFRPGTPSIMPDSVPNELPPGTPLPVEQPVINPSPGTNPQPQPYFVPQGDPVPNPNYDPNAAPSPQNQPYIIPGVRIVPSPTADEPWRVDVQPVNRPTPTKDPLTPDELNPQPDPNADPNSQPDPGAGDNPKPEEQQSLCEKHPEIVACQKLGTLGPAEPLKNTDKNLLINKDEGWGPSNGSCPAPRTINIASAGRSYELSFQPLCDFANGVRPIIIALAWLSATLSFVGIGRKS
ncbi:MAG: virulence factor TspB C-terminal domain-related protein [Giesbergeria sp.]|uniref:virulence factor TspB C-terminal domain-related protein n=1 Tax=Giesbergeria sp. TaxID=2818473 RepID=UPI002615775E|nr:virulence factor TspB C-terminal domain-related protein [Giesbergeria sp.]MDD2609640.1 virulence factor TspB C-terminal domain-related protein [Giesbergeria sp.]